MDHYWETSSILDIARDLKQTAQESGTFDSRSAPTAPSGLHNTKLRTPTEWFCQTLSGRRAPAAVRIRKKPAARTGFTLRRNHHQPRLSLPVRLLLETCFR